MNASLFVVSLAAGIFHSLIEFLTRRFHSLLKCLILCSLLACLALCSHISLCLNASFSVMISLFAGMSHSLLSSARMSKISHSRSLIHSLHARISHSLLECLILCSLLSARRFLSQLECLILCSLLACLTLCSQISLTAGMPHSLLSHSLLECPTLTGCTTTILIVLPVTSTSQPSLCRECIRWSRQQWQDWGSQIPKLPQMM